jgi:SAM-dependent methyltransferase
MRNESQWNPSKFVFQNERWRASRDPREVAIGSRIIADLMCNAYVAAIEEHASGRLVDLGCGKVPLYAVYRSRVSDIVCVDWPNSLHGTSHLDFEADLNERLPFPDASFDTILSTDVIEHIWDQGVAWAEIGRIIRPGGKVIIGTPFMYWIHEEPHDYFRLTPYSLRAACKQAGLEVLYLKRVGGAPEIICDISAKVAASVHPYVGRATSATLARLLRFRLIQRISQRMPQFTLAHLLVACRPTSD